MGCDAWWVYLGMVVGLLVDARRKVKNNPITQKEYARKHYILNKQKIINRAAIRRQEIRTKLNEYKMARPCKCGEGHPAALDFHHAADGKEFCISDALKYGYAWAKIEKEILKCEVICRNCHAKLHWK